MNDDDIVVLGQCPRCDYLLNSAVQWRCPKCYLWFKREYFEQTK